MQADSALVSNSCLFVYLLIIINCSNVISTAFSKVEYMRGDLLPLSRTCYGVRYPTRGELRKPFRGCRAGAKLRLGGGDTSLFILMGNVNSLFQQVRQAPGTGKEQTTLQRELSHVLHGDVDE